MCVQYSENEAYSVPKIMMFDENTFMLILLHDYLSFKTYYIYWGRVDRAELYEGPSFQWAELKLGRLDRSPMEKVLVTIIFAFSNHVFYPFQKEFQI